jgi:hypothetical protein
MEAESYNIYIGTSGQLKIIMRNPRKIMIKTVKYGSSSIRLGQKNQVLLIHIYKYPLLSGRLLNLFIFIKNAVLQYSMSSEGFSALEKNCQNDMFSEGNTAHRV